MIRNHLHRNILFYLVVNGVFVLMVFLIIVQGQQLKTSVAENQDEGEVWEWQLTEG